MRKTVALVVGLVGMLYLAGCGGGSSTATSTKNEQSFPIPFASYSSILGKKLSRGPITFNNFSVATVSGSSFGFSNRSTAKSPAAKFNRPIAITTDGNNLYVADYLNNAIRKINIASGTDTTLAGSTAGIAGSADNVVGTAASFNHPNGITTDGTFLYVTDSGNFTIRRIEIATGAVVTVVGTAGTAGSVDAAGVSARFNVLNGITTDGKNLYVSDSNNTIRRILIADMSVTTLAGAPATTGSADAPPGNPSIARFNQPAGLALDNSDLYVADYANSTIRRINLKTGEVSTIAGTVGPGGAAGALEDVVAGVFTADSTEQTVKTGKTARFNQPTGITCDGANLYVTDSYHNTVRKIVLSPGTVFSGAVTTLATIGTADANTTYGITTNGLGLFVTDFSKDNLAHTIKFIK